MLDYLPLRDRQQVCLLLVQDYGLEETHCNRWSAVVRGFVSELTQRLKLVPQIDIEWYTARMNELNVLTPHHLSQDELQAFVEKERNIVQQAGVIFTFLGMPFCHYCRNDTSTTAYVPVGSAGCTICLCSVCDTPMRHYHDMLWSTEEQHLVYAVRHAWILPADLRRLAGFNEKEEPLFQASLRKRGVPCYAPGYYIYHAKRFLFARPPLT